MCSGNMTTELSDDCTQFKLQSYYIRKALQLWVVLYQTDDMLYAVGSDVVTVEVQVL